MYGFVGSVDRDRIHGGPITANRCQDDICRGHRAHDQRDFAELVRDLDGPLGVSFGTGEIAAMEVYRTSE